MPLKSQICEELVPINSPTRPLDGSDTLPLVHNSIETLVKIVMEGTCEADDAAHAPRLEQHAQEVQGPENQVLH